MKFKQEIINNHKLLRTWVTGMIVIFISFFITLFSIDQLGFYTFLLTPFLLFFILFLTRYQFSKENIEISLNRGTYTIGQHSFTIVDIISYNIELESSKDVDWLRVKLKSGNSIKLKFRNSRRRNEQLKTFANNLVQDIRIRNSSLLEQNQIKKDIWPETTLANRVDGREP